MLEFRCDDACKRTVSGWIQNSEGVTEMRKILLSAMLGVLGASVLAHAGDRKLTPEERIERNYALARRAHDAYANMAKTGRADRRTTGRR